MTLKARQQVTPVPVRTLRGFEPNTGSGLLRCTVTEPISVVPPALSPGHLLRRAQQVHTELWATWVEGLTGPQYATLVAIAGWDDVDQCRAGQLDKSTVAEVVRRLVDKGWVRRTPDPADRRRRLLTLTDGSPERLGDRDQCRQPDERVRGEKIVHDSDKGLFVTPPV